MTDLCWCCALWGITTPADGKDRLCTPCATSPPHTARHVADALSEPPPPQPATLDF